MKKTLFVIACTLGLGLTATNAAATEINLANPGPYYVGTIIDGIPSGETEELSYINDLITVAAGTSQTIGTETYDRTLSTLTPLPGVDVLVNKDESGGSTWVANVTGTVYILAKYDQDSAGDLVFLATVSAGDTITVPSTLNGYGISHITVFGSDPVPDGGMTLMLLGGGLAALGALRRWFGA